MSLSSSMAGCATRFQNLTLDKLILQEAPRGNSLDPRVVAPASGTVPGSRLGNPQEEMRTQRIGPRCQSLYRLRRRGDRKKLARLFVF